jgi:hypothetical protein
MFERIEKMDKLTLATLRSHLLVEQCMNDYIIASGVKPKWLNKKTFWQKMQKCKKLAKKEGKDALWGCSTQPISYAMRSPIRCPWIKSPVRRLS